MKPTTELSVIGTAANHARARTNRFSAPTLSGALGCVALALAQTAAAAPEKLAFYYGEPQWINDSDGDTTKAAAVFADYDLVVFAAGLEDPDHGSHTATTEVIGKLPSSTRAYGYVDLCMTLDGGPPSFECHAYDPVQLAEHVEQWRQMGVSGIFLDQAGCDYRVDRVRLNLAVDIIHAASLSAFVNVWNQDHAFSPDKIVVPETGFKCNEQGLQTHLGNTDYTLLESWAVAMSEWSEKPTKYDVMPLIQRGEQAVAYRTEYGTKIATTSSTAGGNPNFDQRQLDYTWWSSVLFDLDAMAWGETWVYSSDSQRLPFRTRPTANLGTSSGTTISRNGDLYWRTTSTGRVLLDTSGHTGRLTGKNVVTQAALKPSTLTAATAQLTPTHVTLNMHSETAPIKKFQFFIDSDDNPTTGFVHVDEGITTVGADYMVDNEDVYSYSGTGGGNWNWTLVAPVTPTGVDSNAVSVSVPLSQVGYTPGTQLRLLAESSDPSWNMLDLLPRSPGALWTAKPAHQQQSAAQATQLLKGAATFHKYQRTTKLKFTFDTGGAIVNNYRLLIDVDNNPQTGSTTEAAGIGAEYRILDSVLQRHIPAWNGWENIGAVTEYGLPEATGDGRTQSAHIEASILPERIGFEPGQEITVLLQHRDEAGAVFDTLPRGGAPWKVAYNAAQQDAPAHTLVHGNATFAANDVTFTVTSNGAAINSYRLFVDRDNNPATGYRHTADDITETGVEYKIENGTLHEFCGRSPTESCWTVLNDQVTDSGYGTSQITVSVPKTSISYAANSTIAVIAENFLSQTASLDHLARSSTTVWRVKQ